VAAEHYRMHREVQLSISLPRIAACTARIKDLYRPLATLHHIRQRVSKAVSSPCSGLGQLGSLFGCGTQDIVGD
jgi:hypothetical protein